ncbi:MAG: addiction module toxin, HicA family [Methanosarcinales archaeon]|nr:MAG: addiction module toxin, HicA family [Methanosarcinales archaeon]
MTKIPVVSGEQVIKSLKRAVFYAHHQKGNHVTLCMEKHPQVRVVVPNYRVVKKGTLRNIIRDAGLTVEEFFELLQGKVA